jgi:ribosomal-protein-alanine N-acetyltransferase
MAVELYRQRSLRVVVSVNIETRVFPAGDGQYVEDAWALKERIRREEGWLRQRKGFFMDAYTRAKTYALVESGLEETLVGFASVRRDGYILFLAVDPDRRHEGLGRRLIAEVARDHSSVSCHARTTNQEAIEFYQTVGFEIQRRVDNYYEDRGDAYYLRLGEGGLREKLSKFIHR